MFVNPDRAASAETGGALHVGQEYNKQEQSDGRINRCSSTTPASTADSAKFIPAYTSVADRPLPALPSFSEKPLVYDLSLRPLPPNPPLEMRSRRRIIRLFIYSLFFAALAASFYVLVADDYSVANEASINLNTASRLGYKQLGDIPARFIPKNGYSALKRLVVIGDVHGMFAELKELLEKIGYDRLTDHIVFTGDVVSKGPDSLKVVELARKEGASCVRGNQDDRILLHYKNYQARIGESDQANDDVDEGKDVSELSKKMRKEKKLARKMTEKQAAWLESCPLILRANKVKGMGNVLVVHAGLVHGIDLKEQDPFALMNMRSIHAKLRVPSANNNGMHWAKLWNTNERVRRHPTTVIYGHYAARGLDIRPLTKGLDTNCVRGGNLTAFVVSTKTEAPELISVGCRTEYS